MRSVCGVYELSLEDHDHVEWLVQRNLVDATGALETASKVALSASQVPSPVTLQPGMHPAVSVSLPPASWAPEQDDRLLAQALNAPALAHQSPVPNVIAGCQSPPSKPERFDINRSPADPVNPFAMPPLAPQNKFTAAETSISRLNLLEKTVASHGSGATGPGQQGQQQEPP